MANRRYVPKFKNGGYFGGEAMGGEKGLDIRNLVKAMKEKKEAYQMGMAKRKKWGGISDLIETAVGFIPGVGKFAKPLLDILSEQMIQQFIDVEGGPDLSEHETMWTEGEGTAGQEEWEKIYGASDVSLGEGLLRGATSFMGSELGGEFMGDFFAGGSGGDPTVTQFVTPTGGHTVGDFSNVKMDWREGGRVSKYYGGGSVQGGGTPPTISEYFNIQGKTLGGSNTDSLAEKLGMK